MVYPVVPSQQAQPYPYPISDSNPTEAKTGWGRLTNNQRTGALVGLASFALLGLCLCCGLLGLIPSTDDKDEDKDSADRGQRSDSPPSLSVTAPGRLLAEARIVRVLAGDTAEVAVGAIRRTVRVSEVVAPTESATQCWGEQSRKFAEQTLGGRLVKLFTPTGGEKLDSTDPLQAQIVLPTGTNYGVAALEAGALKLTDAGETSQLRTEFREAQRKADSADAGLWGKPCQGSFNLPTTPVPPAPQPTATPAPAPRETPDPPQSRDASGGGTYYANCTAARAAGAAPIHVGEPGYRSALDRDKDGVACE